MRDEELSPSALRYRAAMEKLLGDPDLRVFLWGLIAADCHVFETAFPLNAGAYCLLAKQEVGKRLLADIKAVDAEKMLLAEREYWEMLKENEVWRRTHPPEEPYNEGEGYGEQ